MKLLTSNIKKLNEYKRFGLDIEAGEGVDREEVNGSALEVIIYKTLDAGEGYMVEDTILEIDGKEVVDIRAKIDDLDSYIGKLAVWRVSVGFIKSNKLYVCSSEIKGVIKYPNTDITGTFGFDPYFYPDDLNNEKSLHELDLDSQKDNYSARKQCIENYLNNNFIYSRNVNDIPEWKGEYQKIDH